MAVGSGHVSINHAVSRLVNVVPLAKLGRAGSAYTYSVPDRFAGEVRAGQLVEMPFRKRTVSGVILDLDGSAAVRDVRDIVRLVDAEPVLRGHQLKLAIWIAREYAAPLSDVVGFMVPPILKKPPKRNDQLGIVLTPDGAEALAGDRLVRAPVQRELLVMLAVAGKPVERSALVEARASRRGALSSLEKAGFVRRVELEPENSITRIRAGLMPGSADGNGFTHLGETPPSLSPAQSEAVTAIVATLRADQPLSSAPGADGGAVFLLHGVTGSGKTEVYMRVMERVLDSGKDAIMMVPEISLTPQAVNRFTARFPGLVAAVHSRLTDTQRRDAWQRLRSGEARIAVGPRSALFAPLGDIGAIFVDEEHDASYKQDESPRYHARDVAITMGGIFRVPVVLGSATPDVASYYYARKGRYKLLHLPDRPVWNDHAEPMPAEEGTAGTQPGTESRGQRSNGGQPAAHLNLGQSIEPVARGGNGALSSASRPMPAVEIVDLRQELKAGNRGIFSRSLLGALRETLAAEHQALLFLNRRGAATSVVCRDCGYVVKCPSCEIPLTFHSATTRLICHRCNRRARIPSQCPECRSAHIRYLGVGTQRVAEEAGAAFPGARILRWDRDVTSKRGAHEAISTAFGNHEADILVGTQMIAKGLDFPLVTLVGVILADVGLNLPDFRAAERIFQLLTQVAGRAGRAELPSRVIIQTYNPEHYALKAAQAHDYWDFYRQEMTFRGGALYPPYSRMVRFIVKDRADDGARARAEKLRDDLVKALAARRLGRTEIMGPAPAFIGRLDGVYQWHLVVRGGGVHEVLDAAGDDVIVDVDPVDLL